LHNAGELGINWEGIASGGRQLMVEAFVPFERELAVMVVRSRDGEVRTYPVVETVQENHICRVVRAPAPIAAQIAERARQIAVAAVESIDGVGVFGVEMFQLPDGEILINEIAPRPHNSGHYTIEACATSQFENHIRAVLGWPLGATAMLSPAAVMVNILGTRASAYRAESVRAALEVEGAHLHIYAKREARPGRKMGHVTALGDTLAAAEAIAAEAARRVQV
jgi:5-(carboxyamino)imidazole ribonucleotide synthase